MLEPIFRIRNGRAITCLPTDNEGNPRVADGVEFFTAAQAAAQCDRSEANLRDDWRATWAEILPDADEKPANAAQDDTGAQPVPSGIHPAAESPSAFKEVRVLIDRERAPEFLEVRVLIGLGGQPVDSPRR